MGLKAVRKAGHIHIEGSCGEMAFAKATGMYWSGKVGTFQIGGDVRKYQIRTRSEADHDLLIRPKDMEKHANAIFVLVIGVAPKFKVIEGT